MYIFSLFCQVKCVATTKFLNFIRVLRLVRLIVMFTVVLYSLNKHFYEQIKVFTNNVGWAHVTFHLVSLVCFLWRLQVGGISFDAINAIEGRNFDRSNVVIFQPIPILYS